MTTAQIRQRLEAILEFMQPYWAFVNCHMVSYFTHRHWQNYVPLEIREEVSSPQQVRQCIKTLFWRQPGVEANKNFPAIANFIEKCEKYRLSSFNEILKTVQELHNELGIERAVDSEVSIKEFMNDKKRHEVELTAKLIDNLISGHSYDRTNEEIFIVDAGDGKGYLSSRLALQYDHKVLGIDANVLNTENAMVRNRKLQRAWNGLVKRAELIENGITPPRRGKRVFTKSLHTETVKEEKTNYCTIAKFIDSNLDMTNLLHVHFPEEMKTPIICLTGLHTCGNLAPTCLRVFHKESNCKILCNIGCCYHFLKEAFTTSDLEHNKSYLDSHEVSFPMSRFLYEKQVCLGRNARMLAAQCIERTLASHELPNISLFYRAILEVLIQREFPKLHSDQESIQVGRLRKFQNFPEYVSQCARKIPLEELSQLAPETICSIESDYAVELAYLELFYLLRMLFAPILETIILLDRLLYLRELGYDHSYLVSVFDAVISPRHFAIVALKN